MQKKIKILHLEDSVNDSELIHSMIERGDIGDIGHDYFVADNEQEFIHILKTEPIDIVLSDNSLPDYNGISALQEVKGNYPRLPFIFVSGTMGEDTAINAMLHGATDYVLKNKLERLVPAIKRALHESENENKRELAEQAMRENREIFSKAQKLARLGVWSMNAKDDTLTWSEELYQIAGLDSKLPAPGFSKHQALYTPKSWHLLNAAVKKAMKTGEPFQLELELIRHDGEILNVVAYGGARFDRNRQIIGLYGSLQDITEFKRNEQELIIANKELAFQNKEKEKRAEELFIANQELAAQNEEKVRKAEELSIAKEKAEESDRLKTSFLQNMSHEIRTPLNGIIGFSTLLNDENLSREEIKEYSEIISRSGNRLIELVNNVLDISRIQTGQVKIEKKPIEVSAVFSNLCHFFAPIAKAKNIRFTCPAMETGSVRIYSDEAKLNQIFTNLLNNALKFTPSGEIEFGYEILANDIRFFVKDTGIGIPDEMRERIFDRFIQADQSLSKGYEGAGLGLAISKGLVELLGGEIRVESEINTGSTFFFTLPISKDCLRDKNEPLNPSLEIKKMHGKILVAEDDWISFRYLSRILEKSGITVLHAENGARALELVRSMPDIVLVLMDIRMPVMNGIEATRLIKQLRPELPVIAQTAYAFNEERKTVLSIGFDDYLTKPVQHFVLHKLVKKYLTG